MVFFADEMDQVLLKNHPHYSKYFQMLSADVPRSYVRNIMRVDGKDTKILDLDPNRPLVKQQAPPKEEPEPSKSSLPADLPSEAVAAYHERRERLKAMRTNSSRSLSSTAEDVNPITTIEEADQQSEEEEEEDFSPRRVGRQRTHVDEIRQTPTRSIPQSPVVRPSPSSGSLSSQRSATSKSVGSKSSQRRRRSSLYNDLPLKDDPRFSKYFQMIRSRVPRSWVERVIEVDENDPAILDLDPNLSLASQIKEEEEDIDTTTDSTSLVESSSSTTSTASASPAKQESTLRTTTTPPFPPRERELPQDRPTVGEGPYPPPPISQIIRRSSRRYYDDDDDNRSEASSVTFRDGSSVAPVATGAAYSASPPQEKSMTSRFSSTDEVEDRISNLIQRLRSRTTASETEQRTELPEKENVTTTATDDDDAKEELPEKMQSDMAKLSALLAAKIGQSDTTTAAGEGGESSSVPAESMTSEQSDLVKLSSLLTQVLSKMDPSEQVTPDNAEGESARKSPSKMGSLEALLAKRAASASVPPKDAPPANKNASLEALFAKRAASTSVPPKDAAPANKTASLEALFAKRAASTSVSPKDAAPAQKEEPVDPDPPLKDDPEYKKFFKMLKFGAPRGAVQNALQKEGKDPNIIDLDPEKPLAVQQREKPLDRFLNVLSDPKNVQKPTKSNASKLARKRLHWNKIDESKLHENSFWNQAKDQASLQLVGLDVDNDDFASLFTSPVNKSGTAKKEATSDAKKPSSKQKVQLIDSRRRMNGSILLTKFKVDYKSLARQVDNMECVEMEGNELRGMMQLLPTKDESLALRSYLPPADAPESEIEDAVAKLGECEQYMAIMLDVPDAKDKFQCLLFRAEFEHHVDSIRDGTKMLIEACNSVKNSERFRKLLVIALKLGNALNTGGSNEEVTAITLDSLLKLSEAKAFDRQTSVLHYLVSIIQKNDEDLLKLSEDFVPVKAAERVAVDTLSQQLKELKSGIKMVKNMAKKYLPNASALSSETVDKTPEDELLGATPIGRFSLSAASKIQSLSDDFDSAKSSFKGLLEFFGEDSTLSPDAFFRTLNTFLSMFEQTHKELKRKEEAKERKKRAEARRKLREQSTAAKKSNKA